MSKAIDITGDRYGFLVVNGRAVRPHHVKNRFAYWECTCLRCGRSHLVVSGQHLRSGNTKSCGCLKASYQAHLKSGIPYNKESHHG